MKRKIFAVILSLIICFSAFPTSAFATEQLDAEEGYFEISVLGKDGNYENYYVDASGITTIPIYAYPESKEENNARGLAFVATLNAWIDTSFGAYNLCFQFTPTSAAISLLTLGFYGTLQTFHKAGTAWGLNAFSGTTYGFCSAAPGGTGTLSGKYMVMGYDTAIILNSYAT